MVGIKTRQDRSTVRNVSMERMFLLPKLPEVTRWNALYVQLVLTQMHTLATEPVCVWTATTDWIGLAPANRATSHHRDLNAITSIPLLKRATGGRGQTRRRAATFCQFCQAAGDQK